MWAATHYPNHTGGTPLAKEIATLNTRVDAKQKEVDAAEAGTPKRTAEEMDQLHTQLAAVTTLAEEKSHEMSHQSLENSIAGRVGQFIAPVFYPLGYDWKTSIGVTGAFFAREVIVSTMGITYSVGEAEDSTDALQKAMKEDKWPEGSARAGQPVWTPIVALSLMVFVVFCMQCLSTLAIARKETGHWGWPVFMFFYMTALAWVAAFVVYQGGTLVARMFA
jgi:Fe2+ transport system protein B